MKVKDIFSVINNIAPVNTALSYDNSGLLIGDWEQTVTKVLVCLDCTPAAVQKAIEISAQLIITHHPVIFDQLKKVIKEKGNVVFECVSNNISVISMHTNLDMAEDGVNDCLADALGLKGVSAITDEEGFTFRKGSLSDEMSADGFARYIKSRLGGVLRYTDGGKPIKVVAVCGGSGGSELGLAMECADALVTADIKHNILIEASAKGYSLFDAGHFHTENVVIEPLVERLNKQISEISFVPFNGKEIKTL